MTIPESGGPFLITLQRRKDSSKTSIYQASHSVRASITPILKLDTLTLHAIDATYHSMLPSPTVQGHREAIPAQFQTALAYKSSSGWAESSLAACRRDSHLLNPLSGEFLSQQNLSTEYKEASSRCLAYVEWVTPLNNV